MVDLDIKNLADKKYRLLSKGGEMGRLTREKDWSKTPLGPVKDWPQSLLTTLSIILNSKFPMFLWWGPQLTCFYNDAYRPSLGENGKHPFILGMAAKDAWPEIWHIISPLIQQVLDDGEATWSEDQLIPIFRNGKIEDVYWTFSYSPVNDESGKVAGVLVTCSETTEKIITLNNLQESKDQLHFAIDATELGTFDYNPISNTFRANPRLKEWFGLRPLDEIELSDAINSIANNDKQKVTDAIQNALQFSSGGKYDIEYEIINPVTKEQKFVKAKGRTWFNQENIAYRFTGTLQDITEQVIARNKTKESEENLHTMVLQAPIGICIIDAKTLVSEIVNDSFIEVAGKPYEAIFGKHYWDTFAEAKPYYEAALNEVIATGISYYANEVKLMLIRHGKEETIYVTFVYAPLKNADGKVEKVAVWVLENTQQVIARQKIIDADKRFRDTVQQAPIGITILRGREYIVEMANDAYLEIVDRAEKEFVGKPLFKSLPEVEETVHTLLDNVLNTGKTFHGIEYPIPVNRYGKQEISYFNFVYHPLKEDDGAISGVIVTVTDVTESVKIKHHIIESEKKFRQLADSLPELIWTTDSNGVQDFASNKWKEFTGIDPREDTSFEKMIHPDDLEPLTKTWTDCLQTGKTYKAQARLKSRTGDYHWFYVHGEPLRNEEGKIEKWSGAFIDVSDQKKAEHELISALLQIEESELRFRYVANSVPVLIWMAGTDNLRSFFNTEWLNFTGRSLDEEKGNGWAENVHPEDVEKYFAVYGKAFDKQEEFQLQYRLKRCDGEYRWISAKGVPRFTNDGIFEGYIGACMDIHEQIIYQKKLKEDEERLNIVIAASELGTWELNVKTDKGIFSKRCLEILGIDGDPEIAHPKMLEQIHSEDVLIRDKAFEKAYDTGQLHYESRMLWKDKSVHWIEAKGKVFYDEDNHPSHLIGTIRDITEEKFYQQKLQEREQKFRLLADSMPQLIWTGDAQGNLNYFSQSVYNYTGLTPHEIAQDGWLQIVHPEDRDENVKLWANSIETGTDFNFEHRFRRFDGEYRWQLSRAIPQKDADGNIQMWVGTSTDIQEMKELDQQKDYFISMASHELKTPITSIKGYVQILQSMYQNSEDHFLKNSLGIVDKQIITITNLISALLDLSKIKSGSLVLNKERFDTNSLIEEMIDEIKHINPEYAINFSANSNVEVYADRDRIGQVLINFLTNAVKYSPETKTVEVKSYVENNNLVISVQDFGIGISKNDQAKIFERFYRVEGKNEKTFPGFGIGLFIAAEIINRHNGNIGVSSEPAKGSVFYFSLPVNN